MTNVNVNDLGLRGQRALVTGASSVIGAGVARGLAAPGATVVLNYVSGRDQAHKRSRPYPRQSKSNLHR
jgi:NAD(P)-dependent dehydrogenase (short-subunit alcohol dehydrogenase family)